MKIYIAVLLLMLMYSSVNAELFKWKDAEGNLIYSDQPPPGHIKEDAKVDKESLPDIISLPAVEASSTAIQPKSSKNSNKSGNIYQNLAIVQPVHDTSVRENSGKVHITVQVGPENFVERGHKLIIYLDGKEVSKGEQTSVMVDNVDRGTHTVKASIINRAGQSIKETGITSFTLHRYHI